MVVFKRIIFCLSVFTTIFSYSQDEKRLALVIGNANYEKGELKNPVNDARLIASTLDSLDFDVILKENLATKRDMTAAIREFGSKRSEYDVAFVYYAGHGIQVDDENFLLPTKEVFEEEFDVIDYGVSVQNIMRYLVSQTDEVNILILDACRDNPFESNWNNNRSLKGGGLAKIPPPTGSLIAFSTDSGQTAPDGDGENSVYTTSLSKNMLLKATSIDQVFRNVRKEVFDKTNKKQRPIEATQLTGEAFYLIKRDYDKELKIADKLIDQKKYKEAIFLLESIHNSNIKNLDIISILVKAYTLNASNFVDPEGLNIKAKAEFSKAYQLLAKYIPERLNEFDLNKPVGESKKMASLFYRKSRLIYSAESDPDPEQVFLNLEMAEKYDPNNPYYNYYHGVMYHGNYFDYEMDVRKIYTMQFETAIKKYKSKIIEKGEDPEDYYYMGFCYYNIGNFESAIKNWEKALSLDEENVGYLSFIGQKYAFGGSPEKGIEYFDRAKSICNDCSELYFYSGYFNLKLLNFDKAISDYTIFYQISDNQLDKERRLYRAMAYFSKAVNSNSDDLAIENYILALNDLNSSIDFLLKDHINNFSKLKLSKLISDNIVDVEYLKRLISLRAETYFHLSEKEMILKKNYDKSLQNSYLNYNVLIQNNVLGENAENITQLFKILYLAGKYDELIANAETILNLHSDNLTNLELSDIFTTLGMTYSTLNKSKNALKYYKLAIDLNPIPENIDQYAITLFENEDYENALIYFNMNINNSPNNSIYWNNRGMYYFNTGDYQNAKKDFLKSLEINKGLNFQDLLMLLRISVMSNDFSNQLKYSYKIKEIMNEDILSNYWLYEIYNNQKRHVKAIVYLSHVIELKKSSDLNVLSYSKFSDKTPNDEYIIEEHELYTQRGNLFKIIGEQKEACEDYKTAHSLVKDPEKKNEVDRLISQNCNQ